MKFSDPMVGFIPEVVAVEIPYSEIPKANDWLVDNGLAPIHGVQRFDRIVTYLLPTKKALLLKLALGGAQ